MVVEISGIYRYTEICRVIAPTWYPQPVLAVELRENLHYD